MNKTILNLDYKISIIIVSALGILFAFLSNVFYVDGLMEFVLLIFRFLLFIGVFLALNLVEKNNLEFKKSLKRMLGYVSVSSFLNIIFAIFSTTHLLRGVFITLSGITCVWLIYAFIVEILKLYINNKIIDSMLLINEKIGSVLANPIIKIINSTND